MDKFKSAITRFRHNPDKASGDFSVTEKTAAVETEPLPVWEPPSTTEDKAVRIKRLQESGSVFAHIPLNEID